MICKFTTVDTGAGYDNANLLLNTFDIYNNPLTIRHYSWSYQTLSWVLGYIPTTFYTHFYYEYYFASAKKINKPLQKILIYPSPTSSFITIKLVQAEQGIRRFNITDMHGRLLRQWTELVSSGTSTRTIPVTEFSEGIYILSLENCEDKLFEKFTVVK
jgi:hypothetical protein